MITYREFVAATFAVLLLLRRSQHRARPVAPVINGDSSGALRVFREIEKRCS